ncbi:hypothetical protein CK203_056591 [Vitis vinifera]|uniref:Retrotransposon Copia-like N-terminal domain-containing protein n=1 Tax=Vitis vinifera TaxID=29760 RepID=A0A438GW30_VITVI|nr:hypothetical protein CK203_056591 [Vitis vinifera]
MLDISNESTTVPQPSLNNPIITNFLKISPTTSESHSVQITTIRLNGDNFLRWSQSVRMYMKGHGKMGYLTGEKKAPAVDDPNYAIWDAENSMVMTWLVNSMEEDINSNYMCYPTAQELWENVNQMYSDLGNQSQIFELTLKLGEIRQGEDNVTKYFNSLKRIWQDLDLFNTYEWKSIEDGLHHKKTMEDNQIFNFLVGLNVEFDEVRGRFIGRQPLPSIGEAFSEVRREESRRNVMLGKKGLGVAIEGSALVATGGGYNKAAAFQRKLDERPWVWCDFCNKPRHTRENCWKIHGKPANWKGKTGDKPGRAIIPTANEAETSPFTIEQMEHLLALLKSNLTSGTSSVSLAHTGKGLIKIPEGIDLKSVLHDQSLGKTIGSARMINGLYYFEDNLPSNKIAQGLRVAVILTASHLIDRMPTRILQYTTPLECLKKGEKLVEPNFWEIVKPLPSVIFDISLEKENKETKPTESESEIGLLEEEILRMKKNRNNLEPTVYSRKKVLGRSKDQPIIPAHGQPKALGNGSLNVSGNPPSIPTHIHVSSSSVTDLSLPSHFGPSPKIFAPEPGLGLAPIVPAQDLDLDLPIALRKGTRACTKHPIAKYISYSNLSDNYRAFTTNISKLVVPRNIQETLDEPSWKLAVFEEMNALKKNGT